MLKSYENYKNKRMILDSCMLMLFTSWIKEVDINELSEEKLNEFYERAQEGARIRNEFCNRHKVYTFIFNLFNKSEEKNHK